MTDNTAEIKAIQGAPPSQRHRRSIRLKGYDYRQPGAYFVTICTHRWQSLFGEAVDGKLTLSPFGRVVKEEWLRTAKIRTYVRLDEYVVMPNHFHGIVMIFDNSRGTARCAPTDQVFGKIVPGSLPAIVRAFKSAATKRINQVRNTPGQPVWQRNYFEHVIRIDEALNRIRAYIHYNPARWDLDKYNPDSDEQDDFDRWLEGRR